MLEQSSEQLSWKTLKLMYEHLLFTQCLCIINTKLKSRSKTRWMLLYRMKYYYYHFYEDLRRKDPCAEHLNASL